VRDRTRGPHLRPVLAATRFALWWWLAVGTAVCCAVVLGITAGPAQALAAGTGFWVLFGFVALGELRPVVASGRADPDGITLATAFLFAVMLHWGIELALLAVVVSSALGELVRGKRAFALAFNVAQYTISYSAAWCVLLLTGWEASGANPAALAPADLLPIAAAAVVYHLVNIVVVGTGLGLIEGRRPHTAIFEDFTYYASTTGGVLGLSPLVVVVLVHHWAFLPLLLLPLFLLYKTAAMSLEREERSLLDELTGLGNRARLLDRFQTYVDDDRSVAVCLLDLDRFKEVNDTLGHSVGDEVLRLVADRLRAGVRPQDTVARLGGDEFVLLLEVDTIEEAVAVVDRLVLHLQRPYEVGGARLEVDASSGVALLPDHGRDLEVLLRRADAAMYAAKEASSPTVVFTDELEHLAPSSLELLADLRRGIVESELEVHFQPQVRVADGVPVRLEALVRWRHPQRGLLSPDRFLPMVERTAVMRALTAEVLEQVLDHLAGWYRDGIAVPVAVNVTLHDLADGRFADQVIDGLHRYRLPASLLSLEITEQALVGDPVRVRATLVDLRAAGIELALDDVGTGHASLARLKHLPLDEVKIDRSFVAGLEGCAEDLAIVRAVIELSRGLELRCVAEGVESASAMLALGALGCDLVQGYHLSRPMPAGEVPDWLAAHRAGTAATAPVGAHAAHGGARAGG
jgi:diguanylate cyclase (GGDEF)-like protein